MAEGGEGRLRLTVLGGYLGSGKTTWLRHQLHVGGLGLRVRVVVNEAAAMPVDDALLTADAGVSLLAGGCCCCEGREALVSELRRLCDTRSREIGGDPRLERIVLETSGLAEPAAIVAAVQRDPVLVHHVLVEETVVAVDAVNALAQLRTEPLGRRQVEAADRLILTKTDACVPAALATLRATLRRLNAHATVGAAVRGEETALPPEPEGIAAVEVSLAHDADTAAPIVAAQLALPADLDWASLSIWLSALLHAHGEELVRVKGVVRTPAGRLLLQSVRKAIQAPEILPEPGDAQRDGTLAVIGRGFRRGDLERSLQRFLAGDAASG